MPWIMARKSLWSLLIAACAVLCACHRIDHEQALHARIDAMRDAVQQRDVGAMMEGVAPDFVGNGGLDRRGLQRLMQLQVLGNASIGATTGPVTVALHGTRADARFDILLTAGQRFLPERARAYHVISSWRLEDGDWILQSAQWTPVGG